MPDMSDTGSDFAGTQLDIGDNVSSQPATPPGDVVVISDSSCSRPGFKKRKPGEVSVIPGGLPLSKFPTPMDEAIAAKKEIIEHEWFSSSTIQMLGSAIIQRLKTNTERLDMDEWFLVHPLYVKLDLEELGTIPKPFSAVRYAMIPLHHKAPSGHWSLAMVDLENGLVFWYNPLPAVANAKEAVRLIPWLEPLGRKFEFRVEVWFIC